MKKKVFLLLLPLVMSLVSCGKDVSPNMDKIDLARLLSNDEINEALDKIEDNFVNKLSGMEVNLAMIYDDLVDQKKETTMSGSLKIKGDEYAESNAEMTTKVQNSFYTYTDKQVTNNKVAAFGEYYISMNESYKDGKKDDKTQLIDFDDKDGETIVQTCTNLPFDEDDIEDATVGVDKRDNIYIVYSEETIITKEGHDKDGKDATFIDKTTYEISGKLGSLKDPKVESYKIVRKMESNYDKQLKIYKDYQLVESNVVSYKFEYKNYGKNDGKDKFINSLPEHFIGAGEVFANAYTKLEGESNYSIVSSNMLNLSSSKINYDAGTYFAKLNNYQLNKNYAYTFDGVYSLITLDKSNQEIIFEDRQCDKFDLTASEDVIIETVNNVKYFKLKENYNSSVADFEFTIGLNDNRLSVVAL